MSEEDFVVRAQFRPGGREYNYYCPGAVIGDTITGHGATGPAKVVAYGRRNYNGPLKQAIIINKREHMAPSYAPQQDQTAVEFLETQLKVERKRAKLARKSARELKAQQVEIARLRAVAMDALEHVAMQTDDYPASVAAAVELLKHA